MCVLQFIGQTGLVVYADGGRSVLVSYNDSIFYNINVAAVTKVCVGVGVVWGKAEFCSMFVKIGMS